MLIAKVIEACNMQSSVALEFPISAKPLLSTLSLTESDVTTILASLLPYRYDRNNPACSHWAGITATAT